MNADFQSTEELATAMTAHGYRSGRPPRSPVALIDGPACDAETCAESDCECGQNGLEYRPYVAPDRLAANLCLTKATLDRYFLKKHEPTTGPIVTAPASLKAGSKNPLPMIERFILFLRRDLEIEESTDQMNINICDRLDYIRARLNTVLGEPKTQKKAA